MERCPCCGQPNDAISGLPSCICKLESRTDLDGQPGVWCATHQRLIQQPEMPAITGDQLEQDLPDLPPLP